MSLLDRLLGKGEPTRRRTRARAEEIPIDRGGGEIQELKEALRHYAREAARSAATRDGMREVEELKRQLRERAAILAERERELEARERELEQFARQLRGSRRRLRRPERRRRRPRPEPASNDSDS
jgi:chromosome segregation ATPase